MIKYRSFNNLLSFHFTDNFTFIICKNYISIYNSNFIKTYKIDVSDSFIIKNELFFVKEKKLYKIENNALNYKSNFTSNYNFKIVFIQNYLNFSLILENLKVVEKGEFGIPVSCIEYLNEKYISYEDGKIRNSTDNYNSKDNYNTDNNYNYNHKNNYKDNHKNFSVLFDFNDSIISSIIIFNKKSSILISNHFIASILINNILALGEINTKIILYSSIPKSTIDILSFNSNILLYTDFAFYIFDQKLKIIDFRTFEMEIVKIVVFDGFIFIGYKNGIIEKIE